MMLLLLLLLLLWNVDSEYMYDLEIDPYESNNIQNDDEYSSYKTYLKGRVTYWQSKLVEPTIPDWSNSNSSFEKCGGICPWDDGDDDDDLINDDNIEIKYTYEKAPNIIIVLVDDWGYNDLGLISSYLKWTTPNIDKMSEQGITLTNFFTHEMCVPSRGALLTGRYATRLGLWQINSIDAELPPSEITIAQELKTAGYKTNLVGKWHLGMSKTKLLPTYRGFDSFFGLYGGYADYWSKKYEGWLDLHDDNNESTNLVSDSDYLDEEYHNAYLIQSKAEEVIKTHSENYPDDPLFLLYSLQLIHYPWEAPGRFLSRCEMPTTDDPAYNGILYNYCGMNLMLDEAIDNGGEKTIVGNSYPLRGHKGSLYRGGLSSTLIIYSTTLLSDMMQGKDYKGLMHVTDILPTIMAIATNNEWSGSMIGAELDGFSMWDYIQNNYTSPRTEIVHFVDSSEYSIQTYSIKLNGGGEAPNDQEEPDFVFSSDLNANDAYYECETSLTSIEGIDEIDNDAYSNVIFLIPFYLLSSLTCLGLFIMTWIIIIPMFSCDKYTVQHPDELIKLYEPDKNEIE